MSFPDTVSPAADMSVSPEAVASASIGFRLAHGSELIPGYMLQQRLGMGGYGEVWSTSAPGGLTKAIKILYGRLEESRASHELKALYRIKGLRHPFLLTLERIEVIDSHLVIVTEMADSNLKERFQQCRESGLAGIPRDELLGYLHEAADALDYLSDSHSLQHLDVKPENLLLLSSHVKLGDYGLLKDLRDVSVSMISGLTPRYASPEVFDGRPSRRSDQYSLAIVFQEMATGELPFDGRTSATLASQHLHSAPSLAGMTPQERFAVGKALSKDPVRRFGSCREFVARLMQRSSATILTGAGEATPASANAACHTASRPANAGNWAPPVPHPAAVHDGQTLVVSRAEGTSLPRLNLDGAKPVYRPAVFIGIGGTGGKVLGRFRQIVSDSFGDAASCPALQFLYIDTDIASINEVSLRAGQGALRENETIAAPLRQTWHYRASAVGNLASLSRRWIYNVPRSQRTEGMRALGRLALLDHSGQILQRLRAAVSSAVDADAVRATAESTGLAFTETDPRIFLVASIAGGTGGGMILDIAYAVRQTLAEEGLSDDHVYGLLVYSATSGEKARNLAPASAYACLRELQYFSLSGCDYPGEPGCGLAGFRESGSAFKNTYLVDLGDGVDEEAFAQEIDRMGTYLFLNSASPASAFFDKCRELEREQPSVGEFRVRTMGLAPLKPDRHDIPSQWAETLCKGVVRRWQGGAEATDADLCIHLSDYARLFEACDGKGSSPGDFNQKAARRMTELHVTTDHIAAAVKEKLRERLGENLGGYLEKIISESIPPGSRTDSVGEPLVTSVLRRLHGIAGVKECDDAVLPDRLQSLREVGAALACRIGNDLGNSLQSWLLSLADAFETHAAAASQTADWVANYLESIEADLREQVTLAAAERSKWLERLLQWGADPKANRPSHRGAAAECLMEYTLPLADELSLEMTLKTVRVIRPFVTAASDRLRELWKDLNRLSEEFTVDPLDVAPGHSRADDAFLTPSAELFAGRQREMIEQLDNQIRAAFFGGRQTLRQVFAESPEVRADLLAKLRSGARKVILRCCREATVFRIQEALAGKNVQGLTAALERCSRAATPKLNVSSGGAKRLLLAVPEGLDVPRLEAKVQQASGDESTVVEGGWQEALLCYEVEQLTLDDIASRFLRSRPDCEELASRLHSRIDVNW